MSLPFQDIDKIKDEFTYANGKNNHKFWLETAIGIEFLIAQHFHGHGGFRRDFFGGAVTNEYGLAAPLDRHSFSHWHLTEIKFRKGHGQHSGGRGHGGHKLDHQQSSRRGVGKSDRREHQVRKGAAFRFCDLVHSVVVVAVIDAAKIVIDGKWLDRKSVV